MVTNMEAETLTHWEWSSSEDPPECCPAVLHCRSLRSSSGTAAGSLLADKLILSQIWAQTLEDVQEKGDLWRRIQTRTAKLFSGRYNNVGILFYKTVAALRGMHQLKPCRKCVCVLPNDVSSYQHTDVTWRGGAPESRPRYVQPSSGGVTWVCSSFSETDLVKKTGPETCTQAHREKVETLSKVTQNRAAVFF